MGVYIFALIISILYVLIIISYFLAVFKDPGTIKPDSNLDFLELLNKFNPTELCPDCKVIRTARSRHCAICNVCVERFDHHCPWINNCVGINNHNYFLMFLGTTWALCLTVITMTIISIVIEKPGPEIEKPLHIFCVGGLCDNSMVWLIFGIIDFSIGFLFFWPIS